jgi:hypothetical protein
MQFIHEDPEFSDLVSVVAGKRKLSRGLVEKDYWVTHVLWKLHDAGFDVWFKGGTSLSKGFGLIQRFSEDLDLKIEAGRVAGLPEVSNWKSEGTTATNQRKQFFATLKNLIEIPRSEIRFDDTVDTTWRSAGVQVHYESKFKSELAEVMRPYVLLEIGSARVTPSVDCLLGSFIHDELIESNALSRYFDNRPKKVRCVHPWVTLIEKLDAITRRFHAGAPADTFVRHYEDCAHIIAANDKLPPLEQAPGELAAEMLSLRQIRKIPEATDDAFALASRTDEVDRAYRAVASMFWGERVAIEECCSRIREWITENLVGAVRHAR